MREVKLGFLPFLMSHKKNTANLPDTLDKLIQDGKPKRGRPSKEKTKEKNQGKLKRGRPSKEKTKEKNQGKLKKKT